MKITNVALALAVACTRELSLAHAEVLRWKCAYSSMASPTGITGEIFSLEFALDTVTKKAVIIGNAGMSNVEAHGGSQGLTFQELLASGSVQTDLPPEK